ncbi:MAG: GTP-binding protein [Eubacteriales bacterium]|nr:GTP-binding protein [Eubacteriales bacterium]
MRILILSGFLGSGKTTLLMQLARRMAGGAADGSPYQVVILENEAGEAGVDDRLLRSSGFQVENLFAGCACCTVGGELIQAVTFLEEEYDPNWLILETTGLAYPGLIRENLREALGKESRICTVVDASRWERLKGPLAALLNGQIGCADVLLVNKTDLAGEEKAGSCLRDVRERNSRAAAMCISAAGTIPEELWEKVLEE